MYTAAGVNVNDVSALQLQLHLLCFEYVNDILSTGITVLLCVCVCAALLGQLVSAGLLRKFGGATLVHIHINIWPSANTRSVGMFINWTRHPSFVTAHTRTR
jgi:hypothetical protein